MSALLLAHSFAPIALALSVPAPAAGLDLPDHSFDLALVLPHQVADPRTRDETMPKVDPAEFRSGFEPPAKSWLVDGGAILELGALGSRRFNAPDVVHLSLGWDF